MPMDKRRLAPMDELRLADYNCHQHKQDMMLAMRTPDPMETSGDPIDGVPRSHPFDLEEPAATLPDIL